MDNIVMSIDPDLEKAAEIVAAFVSHNSLRASDLPDLIASVHSQIRRLAQGPALAPVAVTEVPAVPLDKTVTKNYVVCLEDGKKFKSLRRHLSSFHGLTPAQYRTKWGLPRNHPIVAPSYSATRSQLAKESGLGLVAKDDDGEKQTAAAKASEAAKKRLPRSSKKSA